MHVMIVIMGLAFHDDRDTVATLTVPLVNVNVFETIVVAESPEWTRGANVLSALSPFIAMLFSFFRRGPLSKWRSWRCGTRSACSDDPLRNDRR
jgi:hypothetical protein